MEKFKTEIFEKENPGSQFEFVTLDAFESGKLIGFLLERLGFSDPLITDQEFFSRCEQFLHSKISGSGEVSVSDLRNLLDKGQVDSDKSAYIIWSVATLVDQVALRYLLDNWDFFWYDTSDEAMMIYLPGVNQVVLVTESRYSGVIEFKP